jgi:hypothetical protein
MNKLSYTSKTVDVTPNKITNRKVIYSVFIMLLLFNHNYGFADILLDFNFQNNELTEGFGNWKYVDKGSNCGVYDGESFSKLCSQDNNKFFPYYNFRNNDHMGWLRYGYIDSNNTFAITGSSLKVTLTGGAYKKPSGEIRYSGTPVFSKSDLLTTSEGDLDYDNQTLPGVFSFYLKSADSTTTFPKIQNKNRLSLWVLMPKLTENIDYYQSSSSLTRPNSTFTIYPFINTSTQGHYYHYVSNIPMGGWTKIQFDAHPQHHNAGSNNPYSAFAVGGYEYPGDGVSYFNNTTAIAFVAGFSRNQTSPYEFYIDDISTSLILYENDETINNLGIGYDQQNQIFDISFSDKYRCLECSAKYQLRYSFSPITLSNYDLAFIPKEIINFDRNKNNSLGEIYKPNKGYNNIWAAIDIQDKHLEQLTDGNTLYFAVKDISDRTHMKQEVIDFAEQFVPNIGNVKTIDLLKTIDYPIHLVEYPLTIKTTELDIAIQDHYFSKLIEAEGGTPPYTFFTSDTLPKGITLTKEGYLSGYPNIVKSVSFDITVTDIENKSTSHNFNWITYSEASFDVNSCTTIVDFAANNNVDIIESNAFQTIIVDKYSGSFKMGKSIITGQNGNYDYAGVTGAGLTLQREDTIRAVWYNDSDIEIKFTPQISFNDKDRRSSESTVDWYSMEEISIKPKQYSASVFLVNFPVEGHISTININVNYDNNKTLILDKIELASSSIPTNKVCSTPFPTNGRLDTDQDGVSDSLDAFPLDPAEWIDTDLDLIGNNIDIDDDNDGIIDENDIAPLDNIIGDDEPPIIFSLQDITITISGDEDRIELSPPIVTDNNLYPVTIASNVSSLFTIGRHEVIWTATDYAGNSTSASQIVIIEPTIIQDIAATITEKSNDKTSGGSLYWLSLFIILMKLPYSSIFHKIIKSAN